VNAIPPKAASYPPRAMGPRWRSRTWWKFADGAGVGGDDTGAAAIKALIRPVLRHHPNGARTHLSRIPVRRLCFVHGSNLSRFRASGKPGAVQPRCTRCSPTRSTQAHKPSTETGQPQSHGIDPEAASRLMLAGFLLGIVHDRRLMREAHVNIAIRCFAGLGLLERRRRDRARRGRAWRAPTCNRRLEPSYKRHTAVDDVLGVILEADVTIGHANAGDHVLPRVDAVAADQGCACAGSATTPGSTSAIAGGRKASTARRRTGTGWPGPAGEGWGEGATRSDLPARPPQREGALRAASSQFYAITRNLPQFQQKARVSPHPSCDKLIFLIRLAKIWGTVAWRSSLSARGCTAA
jgi:hypothetical protein